VDASLRLRFAVDGYGVVGETPGSFTGRDAWLRTGKIRFNTVEPKHFKYGQLRTEGSGTMSGPAASRHHSKAGVHNGRTAARRSGSRRPGPPNGASSHFDLTGDAVLTSYQVLALPAGPTESAHHAAGADFRSEKNRHGIRRFGAPGRAKKILDTLEAYEANGDELTFRCRAWELTRFG
jgi:hypothetical protein